MSCGISSSFPEVFPTSGQVTHVLLTRPPLNCRVAPTVSFDLHVLSTPPAFILSQDQTLHLNVFARRPPLSRRPPFDTSQTLLLRKQEKLWFLEGVGGTAKSPARSKTRKKTSGTLYSVFKEPDPRGTLPADDAVPPAFSKTRLPSEDGNFSLCHFPHFCQRFRCPPRTPIRRAEGD